ncbi:hypothetical protein EYF80_010951 [Liparis tanakae]|uniref:Uncharacterized protein n=1 Tax=Liparis tanakae TaxID=230148 RepID=A0A4Z2ILW7_9TELE|nr:hypothetical protein EYF80_010951 [Liparis tanakae]
MAACTTTASELEELWLYPAALTDLTLNTQFDPEAVFDVVSDQVFDLLRGAPQDHHRGAGVPDGHRIARHRGQRRRGQSAGSVSHQAILGRGHPATVQCSLTVLPSQTVCPRGLMTNSGRGLSFSTARPFSVSTVVFWLGDAKAQC